VLDQLPSLLAAQDAFDAAIAERRLNRHQEAHRLFERAGDIILRDVRALHEFAQTKMALTAPLSRSSRPADEDVRRHLLEDAATYLERVLRMDAPPTRRAWAFYDLGRVRRWLNYPKHELMPHEQKFVHELKQAK
jgi:ATP-dependent DNA helicase RecG